ncbi:MAG: hypothetical protein WCD79_16410 [Chthoniobacteraceae bacterium]
MLVGELVLGYSYCVNAVEIIDEIKHLPPGEQAQVVNFLRVLDEGRQKTGQELEDLAEKMVAECDPVKAERLKEEIISGFYGKDQ